MTATEAPEHDGKNPFARRVLVPDPPADEEDAEVTAALAAEDAAASAPAALDPEKDTKRIAFAAKMAAGRAAAKIRKDAQKAADAANPDKAIAETERLRQKLTNFIPDTTSLEIWKVIDGQPIWVGDYDARAVSSSKNVRHFIHKNLYKKHRATTWEVVHINADGKERAPYRLSIDPDPETEGDPVNRAAVETLKEVKEAVNGRPSQMKETVEAMGAMRELLGGGDQPPMGMVEYMMMRDMMQPKEDPRVAIMAENQRRLESELAALRNAPAPQISFPPAPESFTFKDAIALMKEMNGPVIDMIKEMRAANDKRDERMREEIKEARKSATTGGFGGLEMLRDQLKMLNEIEKEKGGGGGGNDLTKLVTSIGGFIKDLKEQERTAPPVQPSAPAPQQGTATPIQWPPGFDVAAAKIGTATTPAERLDATLSAYQFLVQSGDPFWLMFHAKIVGHAQAGEKDKVREYVDGLLDGVKQYVPEAGRKLALEAFDANADGVMKALAAS